MSSSTRKTPETLDEYLVLLKSSLKRAFGGGLAGASAMIIQVCSLMWMRTIMNYQYRYGTTFRQAASKLYAEGGVRRFYRGILPGLFQGPLSRFGDTASNAGMLAFLNNIDSLQELPVGPRTMIMTSAASTAAGLFRIILMPIDTFKTVLQVEGQKGLPTLFAKYRAHGIPVFFHGALAASAGTALSHFPWFSTYNYLNARLPTYDNPFQTLLRSAGMGFTASLIADTCSNSIRVVKTYRQTHAEKISYSRAIKDVIAADGLIGLFGRGLKTRLLANGMQGLLFSVMWTHFSKKIEESRAKSEAAKAAVNQ